MKKRLMAGLATGALMGAMVAGSAGSALAGEVNGKGDPIAINANSLCAFSGLEDDPFAPGTVQNWGHVHKFIDSDRGASDVYVPGEGQVGCNAHLHPLKGE